MDADTGWIAGGGLLFQTTDGGSTWTPQTTPSNFIVTGVSFADVNNGLLTGGFRGVGAAMLRTTDGGISWTTVFGGCSSCGVSRPQLGRGNLAVALHSGGPDAAGIVYSTDGGFTWGSLSLVYSSDVFVVENTAFVVGVSRGGMDPVITHTNDGGATWVTQPSPRGRLSGVSFVDALIGTAVGENGLILRTETGGE